MPESDTREEHLAWCKARALEYVEAGDLSQAVASMTSDLTKHPATRELAGPLGAIGLLEIERGREAVLRWIEGFQ